MKTITEIINALARIAAIDPALLEPIANTARGMVSAIEYMERKKNEDERP